MKKDDLQELFDSFSELQKTSEPPQVSDNSIDMDKYLEWLDNHSNVEGIRMTREIGIFLLFGLWP